MATGHVIIRDYEVFKDATITVEFRRTWRFRVGIALLWLAARVLRCGIEIKSNDE